jgi:hypothetical protein
MTLDERIEALTQSVELLSQMHQDNEKRYDRMFERLVDMNSILIDMDRRLIDIAGDHEDRIRRLEDDGG